MYKNLFYNTSGVLDKNLSESYIKKRYFNNYKMNINHD